MIRYTSVIARTIRASDGKGTIMLKKNVGGIDRVLRIVVGLALLAGFFLNADATYRWAYLIGVVPLLTGIISSCPLYSILGLSTCPMKKA
jgi:hypothetical protein